MKFKKPTDKTIAITIFVILVVMGSVAITAGAYLGITDTAISFSDKKCIFPEYFHLYCAGCGGTRAVRYLIEGDLIRSFLAHPIILYLLILYIQAFCISIYTVFIKKDMKLRYYVKIWQLWTLLGVVLGNFIFRNLVLVIWGLDFLGDCAPYWIK